jgi:hypothetical protein
MAKAFDGISKNASGEKQPIVSEPLGGSTAVPTPPAEVVAVLPTVPPVTEPTSETPAPVATPTIPPPVEVVAPATGAQESIPQPKATTVPPTPPTDSYDALFPEPSVVISSPPTWIWWVFLIIGAAGLGFLGYSLASGQFSGAVAIATPRPVPTTTASTTPSATQSPATTSTPSTSATPTPSASSTATPAASSTSTPVNGFTIRILNGTTSAGAAATAQSTLTKAGFTVSKIGNAANQSYAKTTIYYQTGHQSEAQKVADALGKGTLLESSSLAKPDIVLVVVGKQ